MWLFKGLIGEDPSEVIHVNARDASFSLCSQSSLPDHFTINLCSVSSGNSLLTKEYLTYFFITT